MPKPTGLLVLMPTRGAVSIETMPCAARRNRLLFGVCQRTGTMEHAFVSMARPTWSRSVWIFAWIGLALLAGLEGALLTHGLTQGWTGDIIAGAAGVLTAIATLILAYYTYQAVTTANRALEHEAEGERIARTIDIRRRYVEVPIPMTQLLSAPVQAIASNVILFADDLERLSILIQLYHRTPDVDDNDHNQFRLLTSAYTAIGNFYLDIATLLDQGLLDEYLLLDRFASEFLKTYSCLEIVAKEIRGTTTQAMQMLAKDPILDRFRERCTLFVAARSPQILPEKGVAP
jgi:hypothetical protein